VFVGLEWVLGGGVWLWKVWSGFRVGEKEKVGEFKKIINIYYIYNLNGQPNRPNLIIS